MKKQISNTLPAAVTYAATITSVGVYSAAADKADTYRGAMLDNMVASGFLPVMTTKPKAGEDGKVFTFKDKTKKTHGEIYEDIKREIAKKYTVAQRKLLATPAKALSPEQKEEKNKLGTLMGSRMGDLRKSLERRLKPKEAPADKGARQSKGEKETPEQSAKASMVKIGEHIIAALKTAKEDKTPDYKVTELVMALQDALECLGMKAPKDV